MKIIEYVSYREGGTVRLQTDNNIYFFINKAIGDEKNHGKILTNYTGKYPKKELRSKMEVLNAPVIENVLDMLYNMHDELTDWGRTERDTLFLNKIQTIKLISKFYNKKCRFD